MLAFRVVAVVSFLLAFQSPSRGQQRRDPRPDTVPPALADVADCIEPGRVAIDGWLGPRVQANALGRLREIDIEPLLAGYEHRPGSHPWIGEHVGKWLHAATLAWASTGDEALKTKLDEVVRRLIAAQEADGYLGTYLPDQRFGLYEGADWDVWSHKYNLIGLLTYVRYTGNLPALNACRKIGDRLIATFPAQKSLIAAGTHVGMAATSVLEPMVRLYRMTGDDRYLEFARYIVTTWDEPGGPGIIATLRATGSVQRTANAKAYEMLSNLVGLCELARATGDRSLLEPVQIAWNDVVANRLYLTGSASSFEHFQDAHALPRTVNDHIGETCVTTTWVQLNLQLLRLTGEARFGDELERSLYNHLTAAQHPDGHDWCYYTAIEGTKRYDEGITCCHSSGPRGLALAPFVSYLVLHDQAHRTLAVNLLETSRAEIGMAGHLVRVAQVSGFPAQGHSELTLKLDEPGFFGLAIRAPAWALPLSWKRGGESGTVEEPGWARIPARFWQTGDTVSIDFNLRGRRIDGSHGDTGKAALAWGPFVLAYDQALNSDFPPAGSLALTDAEPAVELVGEAPLRFQAPVTGPRLEKAQSATFLPFADAGRDGSVYRVWLRAPGSPVTDLSLLLEGNESHSRTGNLSGSICDGDPSTPVVTFDGKPATEDWYAVELAAPAQIAQVVFSHGRTFHDGGWFDTSNGKPLVWIQGEPSGPWTLLGPLNSYPDTNATTTPDLKEGQAFTLDLTEPVQAAAVRVSGVPAHGDNPRQAFSSCGELEAFAPSEPARGPSQ